MASGLVVVTVLRRSRSRWWSLTRAAFQHAQEVLMPVLSKFGTPGARLKDSKSLAEKASRKQLRLFLKAQIVLAIFFPAIAKRD